MPRLKKGSRAAKEYMAKIRAKKAKPTAAHKDTKSHNVNVKVVSGLDSVKRKGRKTQVNYSRLSGIHTPNDEILHDIKVHDKRRKEAIEGLAKWQKMSIEVKNTATKREYLKYATTYKNLITYHTLQIKKLRAKLK